MKVWNSNGISRPEEAQPMIQSLSSRPLWSIGIFLALFAATAAEEPPAINPFGPRQDAREDAVPGYIETSDGKITSGIIYLTRDMRLKVYDQSIQRQREIPLRVVKQIDCAVKKEWMEREWRFKELASDEKLYTGRSYPTREYEHTITLQDGRTICGPLAAIVYVEPEAPKAEPSTSRTEAERFYLRKRDKGKVDTDLKSLVYVRRIRLGEEALEEARRKAKEGSSRPQR